MNSQEEHSLLDGKSASKPSRRLTRRAFLSGLATGGAALAFGGRLPIFAQTDNSVLRGGLPKPNKSGIEHIVLVMMENRSFDHFLGWVPNADGMQAGLSYLDSQGTSHETFPLAPDYQGCSHPDPDHSYDGGRIEYDNGKCDGWLLDTNNDIYSIGYYTQSDLDFFRPGTGAWTTFSRYFAAIMSDTFPNRIYQHAAQSDRKTNTTTISTLPTIWDRLAAHEITARYYFTDVPVLALWGSKYVPISRTIASFFADAAAGTLPQVSFVDPRFIDEATGTSADDHPHADIRNGEHFLSQIYTAIINSPNWSSTVLVINYDEWGGFFEHVPPPLAPIPPADAAWGDDGRLGFRVPALLVSPWSRRGAVSGSQVDHTSVLAMIEWRWNLKPLTVRDSTANNLALALDFSSPDLSAPAIVAPGPFASACTTTLAPARPVSEEPWGALRALATQYGFPG